MKARSLLHLLLMRARAARDNTDSQTASFLTVVCDSMEIDFQRGWYEVRWVWKHKAYAINLSNEDFTFYARGDVAAKLPAKGMRARNWAKAGEVWRRIAVVSEQDWPHDESRDPMGLVPGGSAQSSGAPIAALSAIITAAVGAQFVGQVVDLIAAALIGGALTLTGALSRGVSSKPISAAHQGAVIGIGACVPAAFGVTSFAAAGVALVLLIAAAIERWRPRSIALWCVLGVLLGILQALAGDWIAAPGIFLAVAILGVHLLMPNRFGAKAMMALAAVVAIATTAAFLLPAPLALPVQKTSGPLWIGEAAALVSMAVALLSALLFMTDWLFGEMRSPVAWVGLGYFAVAAVAAQVVVGSAEAVQMSAMVGYLLVAAGRILSVWRRAALVSPGSD